MKERRGLMIFVDSNLFILASKPDYADLLESLINSKKALACSEMVRLEVMGFSNITSEEGAKLKILFENVSLFPIDKKVIDKAIELRKCKAIKPPDAIVAATALITKKPLWTNNVDDFEWIENLEWKDPVSGKSSY